MSTKKTATSSEAEEARGEATEHTPTLAERIDMNDPTRPGHEVVEEALAAQVQD